MCRLVNIISNCDCEKNQLFFFYNFFFFKNILLIDGFCNIKYISFHSIIIIKIFILLIIIIIVSDSFKIHF